jgi:hypothetical protein
MLSIRSDFAGQKIQDWRQCDQPSEASLTVGNALRCIDLPLFFTLQDGVVSAQTGVTAAILS